MSVNGITSRRRPWPYDAYIGPVKVRLAPVEGQLVSEKTKTLDATAPVDYTYGAANPFKERTSEWQDLFGGFGQGEAPASLPRRYDHAEYVDASIDGLWMLGPRFEDHIEVLDDFPLPGEVRQLVPALHDGVLTVFAICENGIWRRSADNNWTESLTARYSRGCAASRDTPTTGTSVQASGGISAGCPVCLDGQREPVSVRWNELGGCRSSSRSGHGGRPGRGSLARTGR
jgi:hypothetical protein